MSQNPREFPARMFMHQMVTGTAAILSELAMGLETAFEGSVRLNYLTMHDKPLRVPVESTEFVYAEIEAGVDDLEHLVDETALLKNSFTDYMAQHGADCDAMMAQQYADLTASGEIAEDADPTFELSLALLKTMRGLIAKHNAEISRIVSSRLKKISE